jgi:uncharacterized protein (TIGR02145 family)
MKGKLIFLMLLLVTVFYSCRKSPQAPTGSSRIAVSDTIHVDTLKATWAVVSSSIKSAGLKNLTDHGFCWATTSMPDINSTHFSLGSSLTPGKFTAKLTGLDTLTLYYIRSYVMDDKKFVVYNSHQLEFTTLDLTLASVTTDPVTNITSVSAQCGGQVISDGNGALRARGVCWSAGTTPSLSHCDGFTTDTGNNFISKISGLLNDTTYKVVAYVTNEKGTGYGSIKTFSTRLPCGQAIVFYGNITYHSVLIGGQCWLKENLNIGIQITGIQNQDPTHPTIEKYCFNNDSTNCSLYGGLYQWDEAMRSSVTPGAQGICPSSWHIPSDAEWNLLTAFLGGDSVAGTKMKSATGWYNNGNGTNISGFTGLPAGNRGNDGSYNNLTQLAYFWTSSQADASSAWNRKLNYDTAIVTKYNSFETNGLSVRCIRNQ